MAIVFSPEAEAEFQRLLPRYPTQRAATLPALHLAQREFGWISDEVTRYVARRLELEPIQVHEVVTFYTMFHRKPVGKYVVECCATLPCALNGAEALLTHLEKRLGVKVGGTTPDGRFTLKKVECLAACGGGPCLQLNGTYHEQVTSAKADQLLKELS